MNAYLFLSADVAESTSLKTAKRQWPRLFDSFYRDFPELLNAEIDRQNPRFRKTHPRASLHHPTVWKIVGDEILFYLQLTAPYERVLFTAVAFRNAIEAYNQPTRALRISGTLWFANVDLDGVNRRIHPSVQGHRLTDFLGRDVDTGFRLTGCSTPERLVISAETAILLIRDNHLTLEECGITICFGGATTLRGVDFDTRDYPLIWIDLLPATRVRSTSTSTERARTNKHTEMTHLVRDMQTSCPDEILRYCQVYLKSIKGKIIYPRVSSDRLFSS